MATRYASKLDQIFYEPTSGELALLDRFFYEYRVSHELESFFVESGFDRQIGMHVKDPTLDLKYLKRPKYK